LTEILTPSTACGLAFGRRGISTPSFAARAISASSRRSRLSSSTSI
jgi:hypothetical protein